MPVISIADAVEKVINGVVNIRTRDNAQSGPRNRVDLAPRETARIERFFEQFLLPGQSLAEKESRSVGSGFFFREQKFVITNYHVIKEAETITVVTSSPRRHRTARLVGFDEKLDVAVLRIEPVEGTRVLSFGKTEKLRLGEGVFAIGNPFGYGHSVTSGILSAKGRTIGTGPYDDYLQTDAAVNPGNSGGPLFNLQGDVIGINTAILSDARGISFAIPAEIAKPAADRIISGKPGQRAWLGFIAREITEQGNEETQPYGYFIQNLAKNSPAEKAGLLAGDVILGANDQSARERVEFLRVLRQLERGKRIVLRVYRDGKPLRIELNAGVMPPQNELGNLQDLY